MSLSVEDFAERLRHASELAHTDREAGVISGPVTMTEIAEYYAKTYNASFAQEYRDLPPTEMVKAAIAVLERDTLHAFVRLKENRVFLEIDDVVVSYPMFVNTDDGQKAMDVILEGVASGDPKSEDYLAQVIGEHTQSELERRVKRKHLEQYRDAAHSSSVWRDKHGVFHASASTPPIMLIRPATTPLPSSQPSASPSPSPI